MYPIYISKKILYLIVLRGTTVLPRHRGTIFLRYHRTSTVGGAEIAGQENDGQRNFGGREENAGLEIDGQKCSR